ncbi:hypothetical protein ABIA33_001100 [Streptacidiphilus sp. MAP12-16]|uniref:hypothetical protein n=1 Tax=Streptacidiphilus sp. MAP12-16 TaxID=3156300 RepID=UPI0035147358
MNVLTLVLLAMLVFVAAVAVATFLALRTLTRRFDAAVRESVSTALAEDREREIAEARTFWAEQEARAAEDSVLAGESVFADGAGDNLVLLPAPRGYVDDEGEMDPEFADALRSALEELISESNSSAGGHPVAHPAPPGRPGHPAHPSVTGFIPQPTPTPEWTDLRLIELVEVGALLRDVRPGPMGTLDVYVFEDETTLCIAPGDRAAGARLIEAVSAGVEVRLLGSSRLPGAHALTFALGAESDDTVYILADRVVASL